MSVPGAALKLGRSGVAWNDLGFVYAKYLVFCLDRLLYCCFLFFFFTVSIAFITKNKGLHSILEILNADEIWGKATK